MRKKMRNNMRKKKVIFYMTVDGRVGFTKFSKITVPVGLMFKMVRDKLMDFCCSNAVKMHFEEFSY